MKISPNDNEMQSTNGLYLLDQRKDETINEDVIRIDKLEIPIDSKSFVTCVVELSKTALKYRYTHGLKTKEKLVFVDDIIGCLVDDKEQLLSPKVLLNLIVYRIQSSQRNRKVIKFVFCGHSMREQNLEEALEWKQSIMSLNYGKHFNNNDMNCKPILIIINPKSGGGRALKVYEQSVKPLLKECETNFETQITERANHAMELMRDMDEITKYRAVVVVSGDGLLYEVVNGLAKRSDTKAEGKVPIALGIIPGGSGNGLAHTVNQAFLNRTKSIDPVFDCTLHVAQGRPVPMDLVQVTTANNTYYSFLSVGWGLMADIDIESEFLRILGEPRFTVWAVYRSLALRKRRAKLSYLPGDGSLTSVPSLQESVPSNWVTIDDRFIQIYASYQTHISSTAIFAPDATFDDGLIWLAVIRANVSRKQVIQFLLSLDTGKHPELPYIDFLPVKAFRIEPFDSFGKNTVDGELVESGPLQAVVMPGMASILTR